MKCQRVQAQLSDFLDGELPLERERAVAQHLSECQCCERVVNQLRRLVHETQQLDHPEPGEELFERIYAASQRAPVSRGRSASPWHWPALAAAMAAAVLFVVWTWQGNMARSPKVEGRKVATAPGPDSDVALIESIEREFKRAEDHYRRAVSQLRKLAAEDSREWPALKRRAFNENLDIIDQAVARCHRAAQANPADPRPREVLFAAYRRQISFLQDMILAGPAVDFGANTLPASAEETP